MKGKDAKEIGLRVREIREKRGWTLRKLGDAVGITAAYISMIENGLRNAKYPLLEKMAEVLKADVGYFTGERVIDHEQILRDLQALINRHSIPGREPVAGIRKVPVLSDIAAGEPFPRDDTYPVGFADEYVEVPSDITDPHAFALRIKGDSMVPRLLPGDIIVICPSWKVHENKPVVAKVHDDEVTCKLFSRAAGMVVLTSANPDYQPQVYKEQDVVWIYPVVRAICNLYD